MSRLEELINELCPDGVEYKKIFKITNSINSGLNPRQNFKLNTKDANNYYVTVKEITSGRIIFSKNTDLINEEALKIIQKRSNLEIGDVLISGIGTIGKVAVVDIPTYNWNCSESVILLKPKPDIIIPKFLRYILESSLIQKYFRTKATGSTLKGIRQKDLQNLEIPVPPLQVQEEIVRILDNFTELTNELNAKLSDELEFRKKQYEWYRENLLLNSTYNLVPISMVASSFTGLTYKPSDVSDKNEGTLVLRSSNIKNNRLSFDDNVFVLVKDIPDRALVKNDDVLICVRNGSRQLIGKSAYIYSENNMAFGAFMTVLRANKDLIKSKYLFYAWQLNKTQKQAKGDDAMPINQITKKDFDRIFIPVPPLEEQQRIVDILDKFDAYCNDLTQGLPAEIELRKKQYEYYRDKILTFKSLEEK